MEIWGYLLKNEKKKFFSCWAAGLPSWPAREDCLAQLRLTHSLPRARARPDWAQRMVAAWPPLAGDDVRVASRKPHRSRATPTPRVEPSAPPPSPISPFSSSKKLRESKLVAARRRAITGAMLSLRRVCR
jgi:hypothetical protein